MAMPSVLFEKVKIFDGQNVIPSGYLLTNRELIAYVGTEVPENTPSDAKRINGEGKQWILLPGLIDSHVHSHLPPGKGSEVLKVPIRLGVTTILDMHSEPEDTVKLKKECGESSNLPDLKTSLHAATIDGGWPRPIVLHHDPSEENKVRVANWPMLTIATVEEYARNNKAQGADYIKLMQENGQCMSFPKVAPASFELQSAIVEATHKHGLLALAHATNLEETMLVLRAGVDALTHAFSDQDPTTELISLYKERNAFLIPTLCAVASINGAEQEIRNRFASNPHITASSILTTEERACLTSSLDLKVPGTSVQHAYTCVRALKDAGINIVAGTDAVPGLKGTALGVSLIMELWLYVNRCGFSPLEAIRSATGTAARRFGFQDRGILEVGRRADLLLVEGDPLRDVEDLLNVLGVWRMGIVAGQPT